MVVVRELEADELLVQVVQKRLKALQLQPSLPRLAKEGHQQALGLRPADPLPLKHNLESRIAERLGETGSSISHVYN